jgi:hypothetical protein
MIVHRGMHGSIFFTVISFRIDVILMLGKKMFNENDFGFSKVARIHGVRKSEGQPASLDRPARGGVQTAQVSVMKNERSLTSLHSGNAHATRMFGFGIY